MWCTQCHRPLCQGPEHLNKCSSHANSWLQHGVAMAMVKLASANVLSAGIGHAVHVPLAPGLRGCQWRATCCHCAHCPTLALPGVVLNTCRVTQLISQMGSRGVRLARAVTASDFSRGKALIVLQGTPRDPHMIVQQCPDFALKCTQSTSCSCSQHAPSCPHVLDKHRRLPVVESLSEYLANTLATTLPIIHNTTTQGY